MKRLFIAIVAVVLAIGAASCTVIKGTAAEAGGTNAVYRLSVPDGWMMFDYSDANYDNIKLICTDDETDINGKKSIQVFAERIGDIDAETFMEEQTQFYVDSGAVEQDSVKICGKQFAAVSTDVDGVVSETYYAMDGGVVIVITLTNGAVLEDDYCGYILSNMKIKTVK